MNKTFLTALFALFVTTSCVNQEWFITHNGNMPTNERISKLAVGQSKEQVTELLGSPSSVVALDQNTWIYMSADIKQVAFFRPEEISRDVLNIRFNKADEVASFDRLTRKDGKEVKVSSDETETLGHSPSFFQKFFAGTSQYAPMGAAKNPRNP